MATSTLRLPLTAVCLVAVIPSTPDLWMWAGFVLVVAVAIALQVAAHREGDSF